METKLKRKEDIRLLYYRYKDSPLYAASVSVLLLVVSVVLIGKVIVPQLQNWFSIRDEVSATRERIDTLTANQLYIASINRIELEDNFRTVSSALPFEKDFTGVINAITAATIATGAILDDYSFQVGNLSTKSAGLNKETSISLELNIQGSLDVVEAFLLEIYEKLPLVEVIEVDYSMGTARIGLLFYYKILPGQTQVLYTKPLLPLSIENTNLLRDLEKWREETQTIGNSLPLEENSTESATITPF